MTDFQSFAMRMLSAFVIVGLLAPPVLAQPAPDKKDDSNDKK